MIRPAYASDLSAMLDIYAPYVENTTFSFEYAPPAPEEFRHRFETVTARLPWLVWEEEGTVLGYAYACLPFQRAAYSWCAEPSIYLAPQAHGRGIGRKLYAALEYILKKQGYQVLYAIVTSENEHSLGFHKAMGYGILARFPDCGFKFGRWLGTIWMEKRLSPVEIPSDTPRNWKKIVENDRNFHKVLDKMSLS